MGFLCNVIGHCVYSMTMPTSFTIEVAVMRHEVCYRERSRQARVRIECDADNNWWLRPETLNWWERVANADSGAMERVEVVKSPISDDERNTILDRVMAHMREGHKMWANIRGRTNDPRPVDWRAPPMRSDIDPEVAFMFDDDPNAEVIRGSPAEDRAVQRDIDNAIAIIEPLAIQGWEQAQSILRQLRWCRGTLCGELVEPAPGPLSMGLIATREFDMHGSQPELASLINSIQHEMRLRGVQ